VPVLLTLVAAASQGFAQPASRAGYRAVAASIPLSCDASVELVSGDAQNEGGLIAETLLRDPRRCAIVLRASKVLSDESWSGDRYELRYSTPAALLDYLDSVPVRYIILQNLDFNAPHQAILRQVLAAHPSQFVPRGSFPVTLSSRRVENAVLVFENLSAANRKPGVVRVNLGSAHGNRMLELKP
jgi:hypothetical protein